MADVAITNGGVLPQINLRYANVVGNISSTNVTIVSAVADKQIVVWAFGGWLRTNDRTMRLQEANTPFIGTGIGYRNSAMFSFGDTPYVLSTNTRLDANQIGTTVGGGFWVIYSLIDPIDRT